MSSSSSGVSRVLGVGLGVVALPITRASFVWRLGSVDGRIAEVGARDSAFQDIIIEKGLRSEASESRVAALGFSWH